AQRAAGLPADLAGARPDPGGPARRHGRAVPGARRRLVEPARRAAHARSAIVKPRVLVGITTLGIAAACALLFFAPRLASTRVATAEVTPGKTIAKNPDVVRVNLEQLHQLNTVPVINDRFSIQKLAVGQIAFNEDMSTLVLTPFTGRVTRLIARIGDEVKRG